MTETTKPEPMCLCNGNSGPCMWCAEEMKRVARSEEKREGAPMTETTKISEEWLDELIADLEDETEPGGWRAYLSALRELKALRQENEWNPSHDQLCESMGVPASRPASDCAPYAVQKTILGLYQQDWMGSIRTAGFNRVACWGGAIECGSCGYGLPLRPEEPRCPKCGWNGVDPLPTPPAPRTEGK